LKSAAAYSGLKVDYLTPLTANGGWPGAMFAHPCDKDNTDNTFRLNNAVKYASVVRHK
jgi:hypothetical protein